MKTGGCLCGAVRFTVAGPLTPVVTCHCKMCRQFHGGPGPYTDAKWADLRFDTQEGLRWYDSSSVARRGFCATCGSSLFWQRVDEAAVSIAAGAIDDPTTLASKSHIWVAYKGDWYEISDGLPQHVEKS